MESVDKPWHCLAGDEALQRLGAPANGLSSAEAKNRRAVIGPNAIAETKPVSPWAIFFAQFKSILIWLLIGASVVSGALGEATDSFVILAIVFLNAVVGFYQEYSAEKSIAALKQMTAPRAKIWRDGAVTTSASADVVPGDLLELESGDLVAADARLLSAASLTCVEAALTGESEPCREEHRGPGQPGVRHRRPDQHGVHGNERRDRLRPRRRRRHRDANRNGPHRFADQRGGR